MLWFEPISVFDLVLKGVLVGMIASAPMGPVGVLCIQRTLNKGRMFGLVTGLGAALSDIIYALITGYGMSFVVDFIEDRTNMFYLQLVGSIMLFVFGLYTFKTRPSQKIHHPSKNKGTLLHNFVTGFFITFSNPLIIFLFVALFARVAFVVPEHAFEQSIGYLAIFGGALLWWFVLTLLVDKLRAKVDDQGIWLLNRIIGAVVILVSIVGFVLTFTGIYSVGAYNN